MKCDLCGRNQAVIAVNNITDDPVWLDLWFSLAKRRCKLSVEYYHPEIKAIAAELLRRRSLSVDEVRRLIDASLQARHRMPQTW